MTRANQLDGEARVQALQAVVNNLSKAGGAHGDALKKARENLRIAQRREADPREMSGEVVRDPNLEELP